MIVTRIKNSEFSYLIEDIDTDKSRFNILYKPGSTVEWNCYSDSVDAVDHQSCLRVSEEPELSVNYDGEYVEANTTGSRPVYE
jgi:hypothetical protein